MSGAFRLAEPTVGAAHPRRGTPRHAVPGQVPDPPVPAPLQLLAPDGSVVPGAEDLVASLELSDDEYLELHEAMVLTRGLDTELMNLQRQGQLALYPPVAGQEAAQIGCAAAARPDDWLVPQYRELGVYVWRGVDPVAVGLLWRGTVHGPPGMVERRLTPPAIAIGTNMPHAVGSAVASQLLGDDLVTVGFVGDGGTSEGDVSEALNLAAARQAPFVAWVQDNRYAISTSADTQTGSPTYAHRAIGFGMRGIRVDGNDVLACLHVARAVIAAARRGEGPSLVEALTYRLGPHTTSDDPLRYRSAAEEEAAARFDPLERFGAHLRATGRLDDDRAAALDARVTEARQTLREGIWERSDPAPDVLFEHVTAQDDPSRAAQAALLARELSHSTPQQGGTP